MKRIFGTISDPVGPLWTRMLVPFLAACLFVGASVWHPLLVWFYVTAPLLVFANSSRPWRFRARRCELAIGPGCVRIRGAGVLNQTLRARKISAFSVARTADGVGIALCRSRRAGSLILIDVASDAEAERIRTALGIGSQGYGYLAFTTGPRKIPALEQLGQLILLSFLLCVLVIAIMKGPWATLPLALLGMYLLLPARPGPKLLFDAEQLRIPEASGSRDLVYREIVDVARRHGDPPAIAIALHSGETVTIPICPSRWSLRGMAEEEIEHLVAQLSSAAERAQNMTPSNDDALGRLGALRQNGELARDWITRLDAAAQMMRTARGYRAPAFEDNDLWRVLESPDADPELRGAAARILLHLAPGARARVDDAVASMRDEIAARRVRILLEPNLEEASDELDAFDVHTLARSLER